MIDWEFFFHTLTVFTIVGSGLGLGFALLIFRSVKKIGPRQKMAIFLALPIIPMVAVGLNYYLLRGKLISGGGHQCREGFLTIFCPLGELGAYSFLPGILLMTLGLYRIFISYHYHRRLHRQSTELTAINYQSLHGCLLSLTVKGKMAMPRVRILHRQGVICFTHGIFRPTIVISQQLLTELNPKELEVIMAHELGHIHHRDSLWKGIGLFFLYLGYYTPFIHWNWQLLQNQLELAADDFAIKLTKEPILYGSTLIKLWRRHGRIGREFSTASSFGGGISLSDRVIRLLGEEGRVEASTGFPGWVLFFAITLILALQLFC